MPIVEACVEASEFWSNKIRTEFRGQRDHVAFCNHLKAFLVGVLAYVKVHHAMGLTWNARGITVAAYMKALHGATL